jgi:hypothetical protein
MIADEVERCVFDKACTDLLFGVNDRRHGREESNTMIPAGNVAPNSWDEFLAGNETLLCAFVRVFDKSSILVMRGPGYCGGGLDTYSVEAVLQLMKVKGCSQGSLATA